MKPSNIGMIVLQGDCLLQNKQESILKYLESHGIVFLDYEIKQYYSEAEKEEFYVANLNSQRNTWWFAKETFSLNDTIAFLVTHKTEEIYSYLKSLKGNSNPLTSENDTIRRKYEGLCLCFNLLHTSDSFDDVIREGKLYFSEKRINHALYNAELSATEIISSLYYLEFDYSSRNAIYRSFLYRIIYGIRTVMMNTTTSNSFQIFDMPNIEVKNSILNHLNYLLSDLSKNTIEYQKISILKTYLSLFFNDQLTTLQWDDLFRVLLLNGIFVSEKEKVLLIGLYEFNSLSSNEKNGM